MNNCLIEVMLLFFLTFSALTGRGSFIHALAHAQFLRFKYAISAHSRMAWGFVVGKLDGVFHHRMCPTVVGGLYEKVKGLVRQYGNVQ